MPPPEKVNKNSILPAQRLHIIARNRAKARKPCADRSIGAIATFSPGLARRKRDARGVFASKAEMELPFLSNNSEANSMTSCGRLECSPPPRTAPRAPKSRAVEAR
jgi:hypothetical protein